MIDIFPVFFILLSYYLFLVHIQSRTQRGSIVSLILLGVALGAGIAAKWIVLAAMASILFFLVVPIFMIPFLEERFEEKLPRTAGDISNHVVVYRYGPTVEEPRRRTP